MIQLKCQTEYNFLRTYGPLNKILDCCKGAAAIADPNTWGHIPWFNACKKKGIKPILGVQLNVVPNYERVKHTTTTVTLLPKTSEALSILYQIVSYANDNFYYVPRITWADLESRCCDTYILGGINPQCSHNFMVGGNFLFEINPGFGNWNRMAVAKAQDLGVGIVATSDIFYPQLKDKRAYEVIAGQDATRRTTPQHILDEYEMILALDYLPEKVVQTAMNNTHHIADNISIELPTATMVHFEGLDSIWDICWRKMVEWGYDKNEEYVARLKREVDMIHEKGFEDYFYLVADMVNYAKQHMLVGPARGSSAGSLVCWLMGITTVDPIKFGLLFERFIDITRKDLPDIDMDFPDIKREMVFEYLQQKYGHVAHLGTISRYKPKSAISDVAKILNVPAYETTDVKNAIIERSGGDARAAFCISDTFESLDIGKKFIEKYPGMKICSEIEGHARHTGVHAAGMIVCNQPIQNYCSVKEGVALLDKYDAEKIGMLKMDVLGLRTLSVLETACQLARVDNLYDVELEDDHVFEQVFNKFKFCGIFQFEGYALQALCKQMGIHEFNDIVAITSLARPGPLHCGGATSFVLRRVGAEEVTHIHPSMAAYTGETLGIVVYQEQVMEIARNIGKMTWDEVSILRKAISKSLGDEFFNQYWEKFKVGAMENGLTEPEALSIWKNFMTFGSWAFNKSHGVSYALLSYYCAWMKAYYPLEFACACLMNEKDSDGSVKMLRELVKEGFKYVAFDKELSQANWSIQDVGGEKALVGGLTTLRGIGEKKAQDILRRRRLGVALTPAINKLIDEAESPFQDLFPIGSRFGDMYDNPQNHNIKTGQVCHIRDIQEAGTYIFIATIKEKNQRDLNEYQSLQKRGGRVIERNNLFLNLVVEDDTDKIMCTVDRYNYKKLGHPIVEEGKVDKDVYLIKGEVKDNWRKVYIQAWRKLT